MDLMMPLKIILVGINNSKFTGADYPNKNIYESWNYFLSAERNVEITGLLVYMVPKKVIKASKCSVEDSIGFSPLVLLKILLWKCILCTLLSMRKLEVFIHTSVEF